MKYKVRTYEYPKRSVEIPYVDELPSKTDKSFAKECDINEIMARYAKTGEITHVARRQGVFADVSMMTNLVDAFSMVERAADAFSLLPSALREKLGNDPANFAGWLQDPSNHDEAIKFGLLERTDEVSSSVTGEKPAAPPSTPGMVDPA